jgi:RNA polymerase primary sigma factor
MTGSDADGDDDELDEPTNNEKASGDFVWDEKESDALWWALMDAKMVASADSVRAFLKQAENVLPLSAAEEVELTRRIEAGRRASRVLAEIAGRGEVLPDAQRSELMRMCRDGDDARDDLLKAHLRLVVSVARRYAGRGTAFLDLAQVGGVGLMRAVEFRSIETITVRRTYVGRGRTRSCGWYVVGLLNRRPPIDPRPTLPAG